jgi:hypothetical protein
MDWGGGSNQVYSAVADPSSRQDTDQANGVSYACAVAVLPTEDDEPINQCYPLVPKNIFF